MPISVDILDEMIRSNNLLGFFMAITISLICFGGVTIASYIRSMSKSNSSSANVSRSIIDVMGNLISENSEATKATARAMELVANKLSESGEKQGESFEQLSELIAKFAKIVEDNSEEVRSKVDEVSNNFVEENRKNTKAYEGKMEDLFSTEFSKINDLLYRLTEELGNMGNCNEKLYNLLETISALEAVLNKIIDQNDRKMN